MTHFPKHHSVYEATLDMIEEARRTGDDVLISMAREARSDKFQNAWDAVREHCHDDIENLYGLELYNPKTSLWAAILVDPSDPEFHRLQYFSDEGFIGHACHREVVVALDEAILEGYVSIDTGALQRLSQTYKWARGCRVTDIIQKVASGLISHREADRLYAELEVEFSHLCKTKVA